MSNARRPRKSGQPDAEQVDVRPFCDAVKAALKFGDFDQGFEKDLWSLVRWVERTDHTDLDLQMLKYRCVAAEALDHVGAWERSRSLTRDGKEIIDRLRAGGRGVNPETTLEMVRFSMAYCRAHFYRRQEYASAQEIALDCLNIAKSLQDENHRYYRTLGQICLQLGRILREGGEYSRAEASFQEAVDFFNRRLQRAMHRSRSADWILKEVKFSRYKTAQCLVGLGWVSYTTGQLRKALSYIIPAHTLFLETNDRLGLAYLDVLRGAVYRSQAGTNRQRLMEARDIVQGAVEVLRLPIANGQTHEFRRGRCLYELAHIHSLLADGASARQCFNELHDLTKSHPDDERSRCDTWILESRVHNRAGEAGKAELIADKALGIARKRGFSAPQIGALISRGEARLGLNKPEGARQDFEAALKLNRASKADDREIGNPQVVAVCYLQMARSYGLTGDRGRASESFMKGIEVAAGVEHQHVHELAAIVRDEVFGDGRNYVILEDNQRLNYKEKKRLLRRFLYKQAEAKAAGKKASMAQELGITRQALHTWEKEIDTEKGG